ncbi:hypothetical protein DS831_04995 [Bombilactobacillus bombi]|uniref:Uncharacterized protein n=1 Tax=Bombilactobacillus bombi TaxID=1303590 RepID=A0A3R6YN64_9LACO|nr:DUF3324 domain-containing protein [Bombilactobacillus bombi]RHW51382.1 hypothetical protein DS831_04995 [Bombilactobacillus bombi]
MSHWKKTVVLVFSLIFCLWRLSNIVAAAGSTFTVVPKGSPNQIGSPQQGWYLRVQPNTDYQLKFQLGNATNTTNVIEATPVITQTSPSLQLSLNNPQAAPGPKSQYDFRKLTQSKVITLKPQQIVTDSITVHVPATGVQGIVMGGVLFRSQSDVQNQLNRLKSKKNTQAQSSTISTAAISYGAYLQQDMTRLLVHLKLGAPQLTLNNQQPILSTPLKNTTAYPFLQGKVTLAVTNQQNRALNFKQTVDNINIAANSSTNWNIPWQKGPLLAGKYYLKYTFTNPRMHYVFKKTLILSQTDVDKLNKYLPKSQRNYWIMLTVIVIIVVALLILLTFLVYHYGLHKARSK